MPLTDSYFLANNHSLNFTLHKILPERWLLDTNQLIFSREEIIFFTGFFVIFVYLLKGIFSLCVHWIVNNFIVKIKLSLSNKFFIGYFKLPYTFHLKSNSSYLNTNMLFDNYIIFEFIISNFINI